jgi:hypothetical protein
MYIYQKAFNPTKNNRDLTRELLKIRFELIKTLILIYMILNFIKK